MAHRQPAFLIPVRRKRRSNAAHKAARLRLSGRLVCEICGYHNSAYPPYGLVETHHIRQRSSGGRDHPSNLIDLCPTHHREADRLSRANPNLTRSQLIRQLSGSFLSCTVSAESVGSRDMAQSGDLLMADVVSVSTSDVSHLQSLKDELLRIPGSAWSKADKWAHDARQQGNDDLAAMYQEIADQLAAEGYAPDPETGQLGPTARKYYEDRVLPDEA
jgi:hypothetical protein